MVSLEYIVDVENISYNTASKSEAYVSNSDQAFEVLHTNSLGEVY